MGRFEQNIERSGYLGKAKNPEYIAAKQKSSNVRLDKKSFAKETKEDGFAKASMLELLSDNLVGRLSLPENYKIIDEAVGEEGATQELADRIWKYGEKLGSKMIVNLNSARDMIANITHSLLPTLEKSKVRGLNENRRQIIKEDFVNLKEYVDLLSDYHNFEKAELGSEEGFLKGGMDDSELLISRGDKRKYIEKCKEILMEKKEKQIR